LDGRLTRPPGMVRVHDDALPPCFLTLPRCRLRAT